MVKRTNRRQVYRTGLKPCLRQAGAAVLRPDYSTRSLSADSRSPVDRQASARTGIRYNVSKDTWVIMEMVENTKSIPWLNNHFMDFDSFTSGLGKRMPASGKQLFLS